MSNKKLYTDEAKEALYTLNKSKKYITVLIVISLIFVAFFTSKLYLPPKVSEEESSINKKIEFSNDREVTVLSAVYDKEAKQVELMFVFNNGAGDGVNDYYYAIDGMGYPGFSSSKIEIKEILDDPLCTVVVLDNVRFFKELDFYLAPKLSSDIGKIKDEDTATLVFTKNNLTTGRIYNNSREEYITDRLDISINTLEKKIAYHEKKIDSYNKKIINLQKENDNLKESLKMITGEEYNTAVDNISTNKSNISDYEESIIKCNIYIEDYQAQIEQLKENKENL